MTRSLRSSPERVLGALFLAGALLVGAVPAGAQTAGTEMAREVWEAPRYQKERPRYSGPEDLDESDESGDLSFTIEGGGGERQTSVPAVGAGAAIGQAVFIVLAVVVVLLLAGWIGQSFVQRRREAPADGATGDAGEAAAREREPAFDDAARLAAEGRYAEAVHALLLAAIRHFAERSRVSIQPSRTSRELVRLLPLGAEAREAFADLVRMVELSLFGGAPVGREEYERSLARFRDLTRRAA